jgi:hypothetical protein
MMRPMRYLRRAAATCLYGILWLLTHWDEDRLRRKYPQL